MLFASFPFLFLFLPILVWLWKLTAGEDKARLSVLLLGASLLFGACQGLEALPIRGKSGLITTLAGSDGYFCIPRDCEGFPAGARIPVQLFTAD